MLNSQQLAENERLLRERQAGIEQTHHANESQQ
jgi:hypothetical protein